jgi:hypothetical protein
MLNDYWVKMGQAETDDRGRPRKLEALYRIAIAISKLKLKNQVDTDDALETMQLYNIVLLHFSRIVPLSRSPKEVTRETCIDVLKEFDYPIAFTPDLINVALERSEQIKSYIGNDLHIRSNWKLRELYEDLLHNDHIILTQEKPAVFKWRGKEEEETKVKASGQACDPCDVCEGDEEDGKAENESNGEAKSVNQNIPISPNPSHTSHTSHSLFRDLIEEQYLPSLNQTAYRCIEHPEIWYYDLRGFEVSHFIPFHKENK